MQKIVFIALLMLTVSFAGAECIEKNFYKLPVSVFNKTSLNLDTLGIEDVDSENILLSGISMIRPFTRRPRWVVSSQKLNATTFDFVSSTSQYYDGSENPIFYNGYAIDIYNRGDEKGTQLVVTQYNFEQNIELPMFSLSGEPSEDTPAFMSAQMAGDMIYVSALKPSSLEIITFKVGETSVSQMITIPIKVSNSPQMVFGGSLAANQVFMNLQDEDTLYEILVDFEKTEYYLTQVSNFNKGLSCSPYLTNVYHGSVCQGQGSGVYVTKNSKTLELLLTLGDSEKMIGTYTNGDYLVTVVQDMKKEGKPMSYELWRLDTMTSVEGKVDFIICDDDSLVRSLHQSPSGDLYVLLYNKLARTKIENVRLGVLLPREIKNFKNSFAEDIVIQNFLE